MGHLPLSDVVFYVVKSNPGFYHCIFNLVLKTEQELIVDSLNQNLKVEASPVFSNQRMGWVGRDYSWIIWSRLPARTVSS